MNALRRRPSRVVFLAIGLSVLVHALFLPFVHAPAAAQTPKPQRPSIITLRRTDARPTPRPTPAPPPSTPRPLVTRPILARPTVASRRAHPVAVTPPRTTWSARATGTSAKSLALSGGTGEPDGDPNAAVGPASAGPVVATEAAQVAATPLTTPAPAVTKTCPSQPHDAVVTQAVTPDRPEGAMDADAVGRVVVEVDIAADGSVTHARVHASSGYASLDRAAVDAAAHARYAPASDGCEAIAGTYLYVVEFSA